MKTIIVDDNLMEVAALESYCESSQDLELAGMFSDGQQAMSSLNKDKVCLLYTSPSPRDGLLSRMPSSA